jgi:hypothetical protein
MLMVSFQRQSSASLPRLLLLSSLPSADAPANKYGTVRYGTTPLQVNNEGLDKELHL